MNNIIPIKERLAQKSAISGKAGAASRRPAAVPHPGTGSDPGPGRSLLCPGTAAHFAE